LTLKRFREDKIKSILQLPFNTFRANNLMAYQSQDKFMISIFNFVSTIN